MNMSINVSPDAKKLGEAAANLISSLIIKAIEKKGSARIILSTGASQFETIDALIKYDLPWKKVEMFHLDEYVALPENHKASFRKYLKERFAAKVPLLAAHFVNGEGNVEANITELAKELRKAPVDVGVIGIGENAHIAFNDPPADFTTDAAYKIVTLDAKCKQQQVGEGWFSSVDEVPKQAITMCVQQILSCEHIVSSVPHAVKAEAIFNTLTKPVDPNYPATILKTHPSWHLFIDTLSAGKIFQAE